MNDRENRLRAARFEHPERIPISFGICGGSWEQYPQEALFDLMEAHPLLFPDFQQPAEPICYLYPGWMTPGQPFTDSWGCVWETAEKGVTGVVTSSPIRNWEDFEHWQAPDPHTQDGWQAVDWQAYRERVTAQRQRGELAVGGLRHGHTFLTLSYIRGYEDLLCDMVEEAPELDRLVEIVADFNQVQVEHYLEAPLDMMRYPEDLGMQQGPLLSPDHFRRYILPSYHRLMAPAAEAGCVVHMHSDGDLHALADDLLRLPIDVLNPQAEVNGIDWLAGTLKGRMCLDLSMGGPVLDRGDPAAIDAHVRRTVETLGSRDGGLMLRYGLYPGVAMANVAAIMDAFEKYSGYFS